MSFWIIIVQTSSVNSVDPMPVDIRSIDEMLVEHQVRADFRFDRQPVLH